MIDVVWRFVKSRCFFVLLCTGCVGSAQAEIYKSVDAEGHVTYSSTPSKGAKKLGLEPLAPPSRSSRPSGFPPPLRSSRARDTATPRDFPKVDSGTQKRRDDIRYKILTDELSAEEKLLAEARASLKQVEISRDAKSEGRQHALQDEVKLHVQNISALQTELSHIK